MKKIVVFVAAALLAVTVRAQGLGSGKQTIDIWASVYGSNTAATVSNVIESIGGKEFTVGIDRGIWLIDQDINIPTNISIYVKRGSYFLLTNSATMRIQGEVMAGNQLVFAEASGGGDCLVDGNGGNFQFVYSNWFGSGILWTNISSVRPYEFGQLESRIETAQEDILALESNRLYNPAIENFIFVRDTNLTSESSWTVEIVTNYDLVIEGVNTNWSFNPPSNVMAVIHYPPYLAADGIMFPSFVTKEEFYSTLNEMGFANYDSFTFVSSGIYGSAAAPPTNNASFTENGYAHWVVPDDLTTGQVINVHLWGGGGYSAVGGYTFGQLLVVSPGYYATNDSIPFFVTNGMTLAVHVGDSSGRAAIWRANGGSFGSFTNELLVAGGGGLGGMDMSSGHGGSGGGSSGATAATCGDEWYGTMYGGHGGTQTNGGSGGAAVVGPYADSAYSGASGARIWGAYGSGRGSGGDGYYGGGSGGYIKRTNTPVFYTSAGGGGGSGYVPAGWDGEVGPYGTNALLAFTTNSTGSFPPAIFETAYGENAGYAGNPGRVAFEIKFNWLGE